LILIAFSFVSKTKSPLSFDRVSGPKFPKIAGYLRYKSPPTRCARDDDGGDGRETALQVQSKGCEENGQGIH
jgi:hypothetical protein